MIKKIVSCGALISILAYGNVFGAISVTPTGCCSGNVCSSQYVANCISCTTSADCGLSPGLSCPDECPNISWTKVRSGGLVLSGTAQYEVRCVSSTGKCQYQCHSDSYGNPTSSSSGCTICPLVSSGGNGSGGLAVARYGSSESGSKYITDCYAPANTSYTDSTGTYDFTDDCYYK